MRLVNFLKINIYTIASQRPPAGGFFSRITTGIH
nr:MAG TPA_asm: hypothetical protein [Caudoviricetes sp.]